MAKQYACLGVKRRNKKQLAAARKKSREISYIYVKLILYTNQWVESRISIYHKLQCNHLFCRLNSFQIK